MWKRERGGGLFIGTCKVTLRADWCGSLKDKRSVVKSLLERCKKFNVAIAEVDALDEHHTIVLGFACVSNERRHVDAILQTVARFIESHTDATVEGVEMEIY